MLNRFLEAAKNHILEHKYDDSLEYRLCAIIVSGGRILSVGFNKRNMNAFVRYHAGENRRPFCNATHAELNSILLSRTKVDLRGSKIYVVRLNAKGEFAMARPCFACENALYRYGIKKALYTIDSKHYGKLKILNQGVSKDVIFRIDEEECE